MERGRGTTRHVRTITVHVHTIMVHVGTWAGPQRVLIIIKHGGGRHTIGPGRTLTTGLGEPLIAHGRRMIEHVYASMALVRTVMVHVHTMMVHGQRSKEHVHRITARGGLQTEHVPTTMVQKQPSEEHVRHTTARGGLQTGHVHHIAAKVHTIHPGQLLLLIGCGWI
jgi:hypothetical protein